MGTKGISDNQTQSFAAHIKSDCRVGHISERVMRLSVLFVMRKIECLRPVLCKDYLVMVLL